MYSRHGRPLQKHEAACAKKPKDGDEKGGGAKSEEDIDEEDEDEDEDGTEPHCRFCGKATRGANGLGAGC